MKSVNTRECDSQAMTRGSRRATARVKIRELVPEDIWILFLYSVKSVFRYFYHHLFFLLSFFLNTLTIETGCEYRLRMTAGLLSLPDRQIR